LTSISGFCFESCGLTCLPLLNLRLKSPKSRFWICSDKGLLLVRNFMYKGE
jgi:hypothetical protein